jgi:glycosyltransferase involved in cell wall biosynthesis
MAIPRISIIIPCYNAGSLLSDCLDGILAQEYENKEVVIVDGASSDGSLEIIKKYAADHPGIRWMSGSDRGVYDAMNKGVEMATGEWVYFLGADDGFYDSKVLAEIFSDGRAAGFDVLYGNVAFKYSGDIYNGLYDLRKLLFESNICHQAIFYRKQVFEQVGPFDVACRIYADRDLNIRCFLDKRLRITFLDRVIAVYNERDGLSAAEKTDAAFRAKQAAYIEAYNNKPGRAFVMRFRRMAAGLKSAFRPTKKK